MALVLVALTIWARAAVVSAGTARARGPLTKKPALAKRPSVSGSHCTSEMVCRQPWAVPDRMRWSASGVPPRLMTTDTTGASLPR